MSTDSTLPERKAVTVDTRALAEEANALADFLRNRNLLNAHYVVMRDDRIAELEAAERSNIEEIERLKLVVAEKEIELQTLKDKQSALKSSVSQKGEQHG